MSYRTCPLAHALSTMLLLASCTLRPYDFGASATEATTTGQTTGTASTSATTLVPGATTTGPTATSSSGTTTADDASTFIAPNDAGAVIVDCNQFVQDCPQGQKCMPYSSDGDSSWDSLKCVDVVPDPDGLDEPCTVFGSTVSGEDTCDVGLMCWTDFGAEMGTCIALCIGSGGRDADCADPTEACLISADAILTICVPICDPVAHNCEQNQVCAPHGATDFICMLDASGEKGQMFDPCEYVNACDPGLVCLDSALAVECDPMVFGCCISFCDITQPNTCPGAGQECLPWHQPGQAPPSLEHIGFCALPD